MRTQEAFFVRIDTGTHRIVAADVLFMRAERDFTHVICVGGAHFVSEGLKELVQKSHRFGVTRVHKSFAVNLHRVDRLSRTEARIGDARVPVGRAYRSSLGAAWQAVCR